MTDDIVSFEKGIKTLENLAQPEVVESLEEVCVLQKCRVKYLERIQICEASSRECLKFFKTFSVKAGIFYIN